MKKLSNNFRAKILMKAQQRQLCGFWVTYAKIKECMMIIFKKQFSC